MLENKLKNITNYIRQTVSNYRKKADYPLSYNCQNDVYKVELIKGE